MGILFTVLTIILVVVSIFMILVILMQRGSAQGGLGAAMGGGMAESVLGAESSNVLSKTTRNTAIVFFVMVFGLYLAHLWLYEQENAEQERSLPTFESPAAAPAQPGTGLEDLLDAAGAADQPAQEDANAAAEQATAPTESATEGETANEAQ